MRITVKQDSSPPRWIWLVGAALVAVVAWGAVTALHHRAQPKHAVTRPAAQPHPAPAAPAPQPAPQTQPLPIGGELSM